MIRKGLPQFSFETSTNFERFARGSFSAILRRRELGGLIKSPNELKWEFIASNGQDISLQVFFGAQTGYSMSTILLANDNDELASFLSRSLETEGHSVHTALDESSVLTELRHQNYKLIILDINFGQNDGLKLLEKLRADGLATPVLILSTHNRISERLRSANLLTEDYVTKPFSFQELVARLNALLLANADPKRNVLGTAALDSAVPRALRGKGEIKIDTLRDEFDALLARMQTPQARAATKAAFDAPPKQLREAAVAAARKRG